MATNNIQVAEVCERLVDEGYLANSLTANVFNSGTIQPEVGEGYGKFKVIKVSVDGIGTYSKENGYAKSGTTVSSEEVEPDIDLSASVSIDHFDNAQTMDLALAAAIKQINSNLAKEVDAIRIASICQQATDKIFPKKEITTGTDAIVSLREAITIMDDAGVYNDKILIATPALIGALDDLDSYKSKNVLQHFNEIVQIPSDRMYTKINVHDGTTQFNYTKANDASDIQFMIASKSAIDSSAKSRVKFISSQVNQNLDADQAKIRFYAISAFVLDNYKDGIYICTKA